MLWEYIRLVRILTWLERIVVFLTTFVIPGSIQLWQGWRNTGYCPSCLDWGEAALYFVWSQVAMLIIAWSTKQVRARVNRELEWRFSELNESIDHVSEEHQRGMTGIRGQVDDLRDWVRELHRTLSDELGVELPRLTHTVSFSASSGPSEVSFDVRVDSVKRRTRLLRWLKRQPGNLRRWIVKVFWDWRMYGTTSR